MQTYFYDGELILRGDDTPDIDSMRLIFMVGIPGCGKSTLSRELCKNFNTASISRDEVRALPEFDSIRPKSGFSKSFENTVREKRNQMVLDCLKVSKNARVIIDDTNLNGNEAEQLIFWLDAHGMEIPSHQYGEIFVQDSLDVEKCHKRNVSRPRVVPYDVIETMYPKFMKRYLDAKGLPYPLMFEQQPCVIVDLDGTIAHMNGKRGPFEWLNVGRDDVDETVREYVQFLSQKYHIVFLSGRDGVCRSQTENWLWKHITGPFIHGWSLHMRAENDARKDSVVKLELYIEHILPKFKPVLAIDDRRQVVRQWRALGIKTFAVDEGFF